MARGGKRGHKGGRKQFSNPEALKSAKDKEEKEKAWRRQRGELSESDEEKEDGSEDEEGSSSEESSGSEEEEEDKTKQPAAGAAAAAASASKKPPKQAAAAAATASAKKESSGSSSEEDSSEDDEDKKKKGTEGMIDIENPNRVVQKHKKMSQLTGEEGSGTNKPQLSRREREELEKVKAKAHYQKLHAAGKTDEARADLARLAIIKKQREEAAKKREEERIARENALKGKQESKSK